MQLCIDYLFIYFVGMIINKNYVIITGAISLCSTYDIVYRLTTVEAYTVARRYITRCLSLYPPPQHSPWFSKFAVGLALE